MSERSTAPPPADTAQFLRLFTSVMLPMFMAAVDQTLLATATPLIAAELGGLRDTSWIAVAYLLAAAATTPMYGRFGDRFGATRCFSRSACSRSARSRVPRRSRSARSSARESSRGSAPAD